MHIGLSPAGHRPHDKRIGTSCGISPKHRLHRNNATTTTLRTLAIRTNIENKKGKNILNSKGMNLEKPPKEKVEMYQNGTDFKNAKIKLGTLIKNNGNEPLVIKSKDGEEAKLSKTSIQKLVSNEAVQKSIRNGFKREQHYAAASDIDNLFRNSVKVLSRPDRNNDPNVKAIHKFAAPLFGDNLAYITVKEATEQGKRIYSVELIEMGKLEGYQNEDTSSITALGVASNPATSSPTPNKYTKNSGNKQDESENNTLKYTKRL